MLPTTPPHVSSRRSNRLVLMGLWLAIMVCLLLTLQVWRWLSLPPTAGTAASPVGSTMVRSQ